MIVSGGLFFGDDPNLNDNEIPLTPITERVKRQPIPLMKNEMVRSFCAPFFIKKIDCELLMATLNSEITKSLKNLEKSKVDLAMLNTHVSRIPKGNEKGRYLSIDFLGHTHKLALVSFSPKLHRPIIDEMTYHFPKKLKKGTLKEFLEYLAKTVEEFLTSRCLDDRIMHACLSLPYYINHSSLKSGELIAWSKGFNIRQSHRVELVDAFQKVIDRKNIRVKVDAIVNDCTAVLEACAVGDAECAASFVINGGVNAAYIEKISNVRRAELFDEDARSVIMNMELAGFGDGGCLRRFMTEFDKRVDRASATPGSRMFEKFVSGDNMGEIVRQVLRLLTERGQLFGGVWPASLREIFTFPARYLCEIDRDPPHLFYSTEYVLREDLGIRNLTSEDIHTVRYVCKAVVYRSACLAASAAVTILKRLNRLRVTMGVDGYMFRLHPTYCKQMITIMTTLMPKHMTFRLKLSQGGYETGGAIILAMYKHAPTQVLC